MVDEAAGSEANSSGSAALEVGSEVGSDDEAGSSLSDGAVCDRFPDDKKGAALEAVSDEAGGKE